MDKYTERIIKWYLQQGKQHKVCAAALGDGQMLLYGPTAGYVIPWDLDVSLQITDWTRTVPRLWSEQAPLSYRHTILLPDKAHGQLLRSAAAIYERSWQMLLRQLNRLWMSARLILKNLTRLLQRLLGEVILYERPRVFCPAGAL